MAGRSLHRKCCVGSPTRLHATLPFPRVTFQIDKPLDSSLSFTLSTSCTATPAHLRSTNERLEGPRENPGHVHVTCDGLAPIPRTKATNSLHRPPPRGSVPKCFNLNNAKQHLSDQCSQNRGERKQKAEFIQEIFMNSVHSRGPRCTTLQNNLHCSEDPFSQPQQRKAAWKVGTSTGQAHC